MTTLRERVAELEARRARAVQMGGEERVAKQHARGKLTARERIALLFDPGTAFDELAILGKQPGVDSPADAVVCGFGQVGGRPVGVAAYDFTVLGGSMGPTGEAKAARMRELCLRHRMPMVWLVDSGGARIGGGGLGGGGASDEEYGASVFAETGALFREQIVMSGVVPQVAAMVGPGAAGTAYIPGLADFVPMVKGTSSMALGGPYLVKAAVGEDVSEEDLGGSKVHCELSGVGDLEVPDDAACMDAIRTYLSFMPSHCEEAPPVVPCDDPIERADDALLDLVPDNPRRAYDMRKLVAHLADHGRVFEIKPRWARNLVTAFIRLGGRPVGVVANNPMVLGGTLDVDSADKAAKFVEICDAFGIPLLFLQDTPGFVIGSKVERAGIIRHGAKMLHYVASATVPKICVLVRKAYGAGYYAMNGRAYEPDWIVAWPTAEIAVMGPEGMVSIFAQKKLRELASDEERRAFIEAAAAKLRAGINPYVAAIRAMVDDVIDPRQTRAVVARALERFATKRVERPWRKRGVVPV
ncbi:MAG: acyl-CoA carboxylase subunit beta [Proteobacteria bacterium]|nr:MAG: acyl-CoA carboxylase subunit beta [Pseudomonadota bacterium]